MGSEFSVNSYTTSAQSRGAVAADGSGNFVVVWHSYGQDSSSFGMFGQRFDSAGTKVGSEFQVNSFTTGNQANPSVAVDGSGNFVVAWESRYVDGDTSWGVRGQRFDSAGSQVGSEFQVNSYTTYDQRLPSVAANGSGDFVVVWYSDKQDGSANGIFAQRYNRLGGTVGSEFQVNSYTTDSQAFPSVAADGSGNFVVTWESLNQDLSQHGRSRGCRTGSSPTASSRAASAPGARRLAAAISVRRKSSSGRCYDRSMSPQFRAPRSRARFAYFLLLPPILACGRSQPNRILVLGFDGLDPEVGDLLISEGRLPNFAKLRLEGAYGRLKTFKPTLSPILWTTIASAREITARAMRSLKLPVGFSHSSSTKISAPPAETTLRSSTIDVLPIA